MSDRTIVLRSTTSPGFFEALGIPIKQGRDFTWRDRPGSPEAVIINETMAKKFFPDENPIGRRLITGIGSIPREIVGVVWRRADGKPFIAAGLRDVLPGRPD